MVGQYLLEGPDDTGWVRLDPGPVGLRYNPSAVWTGREMVLIGGTDTYNAYDDGAAFDPQRRLWRRIPPNPHGALVNQVGVWTGNEVIVWGISDDRQGPAGFAFDPLTDAWRRLAPGPLGRLETADAVWTGQEMVIWGGYAVGEGRFPRGYSSRGAAFNPSTDRWRELPSSPLAARSEHVMVWAGTKLLVWGGCSGALPGVCGDGAAYDPKGDTWDILASGPISGRCAAGAAWTGEDVVVVGGRPPTNDRSSASVVAYRAETGEWRELPGLPRRRLGARAYWTGSMLLCLNGSDPIAADDDGLLVFDVATERWTAVPGRRVDPAQAVWTGSELIAYGQVPYSTRAAAWSWRPEPGIL